MTAVRSLLVASILVAASGNLAAQARANGDPLTGTWSGFIGRTEASPSSVKVEMKLSADGKVSGSVTGPQLTPGTISTGTFDRATGALTFTVVIHANSGEAGGNVTFDGRVVRDSATGKITLGGETGVFKLSKEGAASAASVSAAPIRPAADATADIRRSYVQIGDWVTRAAELVPAERYSYRPVQTVRTFAQMVGHVIDGYNYYCARGVGRAVEWSDTNEKNVSAKAALVAALKKATAECTAAHDRVTSFGPMVENVGHASLHYGNLITYIRMMGMVPPSS
jgi:hypothetical protein